jgi:hypothetical protein
MYYITYTPGLAFKPYEVWRYDNDGMKQSYGMYRDIEAAVKFVSELTGGPVSFQVTPVTP